MKHCALYCFGISFLVLMTCVSPLQGQNNPSSDDITVVKITPKQAEENRNGTALQSKIPQEPSLPPEDLRVYQLQLVNLKDLGASFKNVDAICWSNDGKSLIVDCKNAQDKRYEILELSLDGSVPPKKLTADRPNSSIRCHNGSPVLTPDQSAMIFVGQNEGSRDFSHSVPSIGQQCNLWYKNLQTGKYWQLTHMVASYSRPQGVSMPKLSSDGSQIFWTGCSSADTDSIFGERALYVASLDINGTMPQFRNVQKYQPSDNHAFYESYGFSPQDNALLFAGCFEQGTPWYAMDICIMKQDGSDFENLTRTDSVFDRYASFSPRGKKIIWSSSEGFDIAYLGIGGTRWQLEMKSELWIMSSNGKDKRQLTFFNKRGSEHSKLIFGNRAYVGMSAWHPDGKHIAIVVYYDKALSGGNLDTLESKVIVGELVEKR